MNRIKFINRSRKYYSRQHLIVFFVALISTAVLTGALTVGDSVKYSLKKQLEKRLGGIDYVFTAGDRFFRSNLSQQLSHSLPMESASVLLMQGVAINTDNKKRINKAQIIGVDDAFWRLSSIEMEKFDDAGLMISENTAVNLELELGDDVLLRIQNSDVIPINAPFSNDEDNSIALRLKINRIVSDDELGKFSLRNNQLLPNNVFINREYLAKMLELEGFSNMLLLNDKGHIEISVLEETITKKWELIDAGLILRSDDENGYFDLISNRIFIDPPIISSIDSLAIQHQKILTYFVNSFQSNGKSTPYSFVSAFSSNESLEDIGNNEIIINSWLANDLDANEGDTLLIKYFVIGNLRRLEEKSEFFVVKQILPIESQVFDRELMPDFPGLSDAGSCGEWDAGIPIDLKKIRDKDEDYWDDYKGSPKAIISMEKALEIWPNKFGSYTAIRFANSEVNHKELEEELLNKLKPSDLGFDLYNVRKQGAKAASNGVDFGELFLSLSFFVIVGGILLLALVFGLNVEGRIQEAGILSGLGYKRKQILKLFFLESLPIIVLSSILGGFVGILYNRFMISGLNTVWNDAVHADTLEVFVNPTSLVIGISIGIIISLFTIYWVVNKKLNKSIVSVIRKQRENRVSKKYSLDKLLSIFALLSSALIVVFSLYKSVESNASLILSAGFVFLVGTISLFSTFLRKIENDKNSIFQNGKSSFSFILRNVGRNRLRSISIISLLALGSFTIVLTASNRKTFTGSENIRSSGTGGFKLWVENTIPILQDLNDKKVRENYNLDDEIDDISFIQFLNLPGDDASCLNLNQVAKPQILGVNPTIFDSLHAFTFEKLLKPSDTPWLELENDHGKNIYAAYADQTVIQWGLIKSIGDTLHYLNEAGETISFVLMGGLAPSIFQGNILISERVFQLNFPSSGGSKIMLVDAPYDKIYAIDSQLTNYLSDYGIEINSAQNRLSNFYSVTNTYLTIFMILGGLGVIIGTIGMGIIMIRIITERKKELAVLQALGFKKRQILRLVVVENVFLLLTGVFIGVVSALIAILPSLLSSSFSLAVNYIFSIIGLVILNGIFWIYVPAKLALRNTVIDKLTIE